MKTLYIILLLSLASCMSANTHVKKAVKKGWTPEKETITKRTFTLLPIHDTITMEVIRFDTVISEETRTIYQDRPLLRYETRLIRDTVRIIQQAETKQIEAVAQAEVKVARHENKRSLWWVWFVVGVVVGVLRKQIFKIVGKFI